MKSHHLKLVLSAAMISLLVLACAKEEPPPPVEELPKPTAHLDQPQTPVTIGTRIVVNGEGSQGLGALEFEWSLERPDGSEAALEFQGTAKNAFTVDVGGSYTVGLVVRDKGGDSEPVTVRVMVAYQAPIPALELSPDAVKALEDHVVADASKSEDPAGRPLKYEFRLTKRPNRSVAVISADGPHATFLPDRGGVYEVGVKVGNDTTWSEEITREIEAEPPTNRAPVANAGKDRSVRLGEKVILDGSASRDPDEDELSYHWTFLDVPDGSEVQIGDAEQKIAHFTPDLAGVFRVQLEVSDGEFTDAATFDLEASKAVNIPPVIQRILANGTARTSGESLSGKLVDPPVMIEVEAFDVEQAPLSFDWTLTQPEGSEAVLQKISNVKHSLAPDVEGFYVVDVVANDGEFDSNPVSLTFRFRGDNKLPVAVLTTPGGIYSFENGSNITLDGSGSYDTDTPPDSLNQYQFSLVGQPSGTPTDSLSQASGNATATFHLSKKTKGANYRFRLVVRDTEGGLSEPAFLEIESTNRPPVAKAFSPWTASLSGVHLDRLDPLVASAVLLNAERPGHESSDPDPGDVLSYQWTLVDQPEGSNPVLRTPMNASTGFYTDVAGDYVAELVVTDNDPTEPMSHSILVDISIEED